jgi:hypothetical protein
MDLKETSCEGMNWIRPVQNREKCLSVVDKVIKLLVQQNVIFPLSKKLLASQEGF